MAVGVSSLRFIGSSRGSGPSPYWAVVPNTDPYHWWYVSETPAAPHDWSMIAGWPVAEDEARRAAGRLADGERRARAVGDVGELDDRAGRVPRADVEHAADLPRRPLGVLVQRAGRPVTESVV